MGTKTDISIGSKSIRVDSTGKSYELVGDLETPANNTVYGVDAGGVKGWKPDPSGGGGGGSGSVNSTLTSAHANIQDAVADAQANNRPIQVDSLMVVDVPSTQLRDIASFSDGSTSFNPDAGNYIDPDTGQPIDLTRTLPINAAPAPDTFKGNELIDRNTTFTLNSGFPILDLGLDEDGVQIVEFVSTNHDISVGWSVRISGVDAYYDGVYETALDTNPGFTDHRNRFAIKLGKPFVAASVAGGATVTVRFVGIPVDGQNYKERDPIVIAGTGTSWDGNHETHKTTIASKNEVIIIGDYSPQTFVSGTIARRYVAIPATAHGLTNRRLSCTISGHANPNYNGDFEFETQGDDFVDNDYLTISAVDDGSAWTGAEVITLHITNVNLVLTNGGNPGAQTMIRNSAYYSGRYVLQDGTTASVKKINKLYSAEVPLPETKLWSGSYIIPDDVSIFFLNKNYWLIFKDNAEIIIDAPILAGNQKIFAMETDTNILFQKAKINLRNGMNSNIMHWGAVTAGFGNRDFARPNTTAFAHAWDTAITSAGSLEIPAGVFYMYTIEPFWNVNEPTTNDIFGHGNSSSWLVAGRNCNDSIIFHTAQQHHNYDVRDLAFDGDQNANEGTLEDHPLCAWWGYNYSFTNIHQRDTAGNGFHYRSGQSNSLRLFNTECEQNDFGVGCTIVGVNNVDFFGCSFEQNVIGVRCMPNAANVDFSRPSSLNMIMIGGYAEANDNDYTYEGVRNIEMKNCKHSAAGTGTVFTDWNGIGCFNIKTDAGPSDGHRTTVEALTRGVFQEVPVYASAGNYEITDLSGTTVISRSGLNPFEIINTNEITNLETGKGGFYLDYSHPASVGSASVNSPWGNGFEKWRGSTVYPDELAFVRFGSVLNSTRFEATQNGQNLYTANQDLPADTYYYRFLFNTSPLWRIQLQVFDINNLVYYNWNMKTWDSATVENQNRFFIPTYGRPEFVQVPIEIDVLRRPRLTFVYTNDNTPKKSFVMEYIMLTDNPTQGLVHVRGGNVTHTGFINQALSLTATADFQMLSLHRTVNVDTNGGNIQVTLPVQPAPGERHRVTRTAGTTNAINVSGGAGRLINGSSPYVMPLALYSTQEFEYDLGTNEWILI